MASGVEPRLTRPPLPLDDDSGTLGRPRQAAVRFCSWVEGAVTRSLWTAAGNESAAPLAKGKRNLAVPLVHKGAL